MPEPPDGYQVARPATCLSCVLVIRASLSPLIRHRRPELAEEGPQGVHQAGEEAEVAAQGPECADRHEPLADVALEQRGDLLDLLVGDGDRDELVVDADVGPDPRLVDTSQGQRGEGGSLLLRL